MKMFRLLAPLFLLLAPAVIAGPCDQDEYKQFDFWQGRWQVFTPDGKLAGTNELTKEYGGCVLHERYQTPTGFSGESLNTYDRVRKVWHQTWVDNSGLLLLLQGKLIDGKMVLEGKGKNPKGQDVYHRITWTPNGDGTVRQHWQSATVKGQWQTAFDGLYKSAD